VSAQSSHGESESRAKERDLEREGEWRCWRVQESDGESVPRVAMERGSVPGERVYGLVTSGVSHGREPSRAYWRVMVREMYRVYLEREYMVW